MSQLLEKPLICSRVDQVLTTRRRCPQFVAHADGSLVSANRAFRQTFGLRTEDFRRKNLIAEVSYVGSASHKLTDLIDRNPFVLGTRHRVLNTSPGNDDGSFSFLDEFRNVANATYNSLQASVTKGLSETGRFGKSYFTLGYTWAHSILG